MRATRRLAVVAAALLLTAACGRPEAAGRALRPTRGIIVVSLGGAGATRLGAYGAGRETSPFFDRLTERGILFEHAISPSPSPLVAAASLFSGLYPQQHGASPPAKTLSPRLETLPERFAYFGYRTAGYTDGGFVGRHFGFHHGFDDFDDLDGVAGLDDTAVEGVFARGLDFLRGLAPREPFLLFLHTRSASAPYEPPPPYDELFALPAEPPDFAPTAGNLRRADRGFLAADAATAERFAALHDAGIAYLDGLLESFHGELERLGLIDETLLVITGLHGEEFLEHGGLGHFQVYPETSRVPLLVLHPDLAGGRRVPGLVQLVDLAPTLYDLAALPPGAAVSGRSLVPELEGGGPAETRAWSESATGRRQRALYQRRGETLHQLVVTEVAGERDGTWVSRRAGLELEAGATLSAVSFHRERDLRLVIDGREAGGLTLGTAWTPLDLPVAPVAPAAAPDRRRRLELIADGCDSPRELGLSDDPRCLSFKLRGAEVRLVELYDLDADPGATRDLARERPRLRAELEALLSDLVWSIVTPARNRARGAPSDEVLRAEGYLD